MLKLLVMAKYGFAQADNGQSATNETSINRSHTRFR